MNETNAALTQLAGDDKSMIPVKIKTIVVSVKPQLSMIHTYPMVNSSNAIRLRFIDPAPDMRVVRSLKLSVSSPFFILAALLIANAAIDNSNSPLTIIALACDIHGTSVMVVR